MNAHKSVSLRSGEARSHVNAASKAAFRGLRAREADRSSIAVLHIFPSFEHGGQQSRFAAIAQGMGKAFRHHVVSLDGDLSARDLIGSNAVVTVEGLALRKRRGLDIGNVLRLRSLIKSKNPSILCTYNWGAMEAVAANRLACGVPHIHFEDGFPSGQALESEPKRRRSARRRLLRKSAVVVPSQSLRRHAESAWSLKEPRLHFIENGVDLKQFRPAADRKERRVRIGAVGALRTEKNYPRLIRAFIKADPRKRASLYVIGEGPERAKLEQLIDDLDAADRVVLTGAKTGMHKIYRQLDIVALSADAGQAPMSLLEAMASGLPVVSTNVGDIAEMVSNENRAYVTPIDDDEAYLLALIQILQNPEARLEIGAANRRKAEAAYGSGQMLEAYRRLFMSMTGRDG